MEWWNGGMVAWWLGGLVAWWNGKTSLGYNKKKTFTIVWTSLVTTASLKKSYRAFVKGDEQEEESYAWITSKNVEFNRKIYRTYDFDAHRYMYYVWPAISLTVSFQNRCTLVMKTSLKTL